ncbi:MAG TPA: transposase [candidate division Zixibacteria bacterium]|nr:transposase [candidate division Zixibacteria bacterium]
MVVDLSQKEIDNVLKHVNNSKSTKVYLTFKQKIYPTNEQEGVLWALAENCRLIYNFALKERLEWWDENKDKPRSERNEYPTYNKQQNDLPRIKEQFPRYKQNYAKTLQMILKRLDEDFKSFLVLRNNGDLVANPPGFKGRKYFTTIVYNQLGFKVDKQAIVLSHSRQMKKNEAIILRFVLDDRFNPKNKDIKQVTIFQEHKTKEFYIAIAYEIEVPFCSNNSIYQAIDLGVSNIIAGVNNHAGKTIIVKNNQVNKYWQPKIEELTSKRDHCKKYSNRWHWYNQKLQKIVKKQSNQRKDFQHKLSKKIIENTKANTIIIGDLKAKEMSQKRKGDKKNKRSLHRSNHNSGVIGRFARFLTYKAEKVGKKVIKISERRTTKRCCFCGKKEQRQLSERIIKCDKCGLVIDRDINASVNIMQRFLAILSLSQECPLVGQQLLKDFRKLFFATYSQTSNESFSSNGVGRTRIES